MRLLLIIFISFMFTSCMPQINFQDVQRVNNMFYYKDKPYSGQLIDLFENSNTIAYTATISKGIPKGKCIAYGYDGEVISEGEFIILDTNGGEDYSRITLERITEMDVEINTVFVIISNPYSVKNKRAILEKVNSLLATQNISKDVEIEFVEYEF